MSLISYTKISDGTGIDGSDVNSPLDTIYNDYNGNIDSNNLAANAVTTAKIADGSVTNAKIALSTLTYPFPDYASPTTISTDTYTAPSNGWIQARSIVLTSTFGSVASITISGAEVYSLNWNGGTSSYNLQSTALIPIAKGQIATFNLANGATWSFRRFYPALTATAS